MRGAEKIRTAALDALRDGGDALRDRALIERVLYGLDVLAPAACLPEVWEAMDEDTRKPGKAATPAGNKAVTELLRLFQACGCSKRKARTHAHALRHAAGLTTSDDPETLKQKVHTLKP